MRFDTAQPGSSRTIDAGEPWAWPLRVRQPIAFLKLSAAFVQLTTFHQALM